MRFFDYIKIALKNIWRQKLRSFLTIIAIVIGSLAVISVLSLIFGAKTTFTKQMEAIGQFTLVQVSTEQFGGRGGPFGGQEVKDQKDQKKLDDAVVQQIEEISHVVDASASLQLWNIESISSKGGDGKQYRSEMIAEEVGKASEKKILAGRAFNNDDGKGKIIIGSHLVGSLGFNSNEDAIGKTLILTTKKGYQGDGADIPGPNSQKEDWDKLQERITKLEAEIIGVTTAPSMGQNGGTFITMKWGKLISSYSYWKEDPEKMEAWKRQQEQQKQYDKMGGNNVDYGNQGCPDCMVLQTESEVDRNGYHFAAVKVDDRVNTKGVAEEISRLGYGTMTADDMLKEFTKVITLIGAIIGAIGAISLGVAAIGIVNTMIMAMYERTREIGIMRACGARRKTVRHLFTFEAAMLGFWGGIFGIIFGIGISKVANFFINKLLVSGSIEATNVISMPLWLILATIGSTTFLGFISGLYPAHRAAKLDPVEALRYE